MNSDHFEHIPKCDYPAIELNMMDFMKDLSNEYICKKIDITRRDADVHTNSKIINGKTEDCIDLGEISSISVGRVKQEEGVR